MNILSIEDKSINDGKKFEIYTPLSSEETQVQLSEIFVAHHYGRGRIKKDMVIVDVGANIGMASYYFKDWAKVIYALEPSHQPYEALLKNLEPYPHIKPFNVGLANYESIDILISAENTNIPLSFFGKGKVQEQVVLTTLDKFMKQNSIEHVDLLKIDTEGAEYIILPSTGFTDVAHKIDYIIGEAHYVGDKLLPEFIPLILADAGFETEWLPIENMTVTMNFDNKRTTKSYVLKKHTIFFAKRKELPWPN